MRISLAPELREEIEKTLREELSATSEESRRVQKEPLVERARLHARSKKLLDGHLDGVVPMDLYRAERTSNTQRLSTMDERLAAATMEVDEINRNVDLALTLSQNCYDAYLRADNPTRKSFNQAFWERVYVDIDGSAGGELAQPFKLIQEVGDQVSASDARAPGRAETSEGCRELGVVPLEGLEPPTCSLGRNCSSIELQRLAPRV